MSDSNSEPELVSGGKPKNHANVSERPRIAKKSTSIDHNKYVSMTRRQAALASKDKSKQDMTKTTSDGAVEDEGVNLRDRRRLKKLGVRKVPGAAFDSLGVHISGVDMCDCLQEDCPGCHFKCLVCSSQKCGIECRINRKYVYEQVEYHGYEFSIRNPLLKQ